MLTYALDKKSPEPLYMQLYKGIRTDIESSRIESGQRLPSKRALASHLGVSVITVESAFAQLVAEGYIEPSPRRGFFACELASGSRTPADEVTDAASAALLADASADNALADSVSPDRRDTRDSSAGFAESPDFSIGPSPAFSDSPTDVSAAGGAFPYSAWARTMRRVLSEGDESALLSSSDSRGTYRLRCAIADHLKGFRGMNISPEQVVIGSGAQSLYGLLVQLLGRSRIFAVENPGYPRLAQIYRSNDVALRLIGLDEKGPIAQQLHDGGASVFHCMPSHQFPTGITTTVGRRQELLEWARHPGRNGQQRYLIEDDYDCEFRMSGRPVPPLQAMDTSEHVIYANTFTKTLGPAFRIGYMVLPEHLVRRFLDKLSFYACTVGALEQLTLARFIESREYERHVNRQRTRFRRLQSALTKALADEAQKLGSTCRLALHNTGAGLHFVISIENPSGDIDAYDRQTAERCIAKHAMKRGVALSPMSDYFLERICRNRDRAKSDAAKVSEACFVISLASIREEDAARVASAIAGAVQDSI